MVETQRLPFIETFPTVYETPLDPQNANRNRSKSSLCVCIFYQTMVVKSRARVHGIPTPITVSVRQ